MKKKFCRVVAGLWLALTCLCAVGQETDKPVEETARIESAVQSYVAAFNARDVGKLVAHWAPDAVYISRTSGDRITGHEALSKEFASIFADGGAPKLAASTESIDFISPNVALERGTAVVTDAEDNAVETSYSVVYVRRDGKWLIDRVTEDEIVVPLSHYEHLRDLEWMVGEWIDVGEDVSIEISCNWTANQNFLSRRYSVSDKAAALSSGLQIIGWDANEQQIRSWLFDSNGSVVTGKWAKRDDHWVVSSVATIAGGGSGSFTSIYRPIEDGNYAWQKINRVLDGRLLPNLEEVVVQRKTASTSVSQ